MQSCTGIHSRTITLTSSETAYSSSRMAAPKIFVLILLASLCFDGYNTATLPRNFDPRLTDEVLMVPKKRPFCNAFTGCGRKRSQSPPGMPLQEIIHQKQLADEDSLNSIFDNESAIDEISRQILSEAKLWEALQEASAEISRRRQKDGNTIF